MEPVKAIPKGFTVWDFQHFQKGMTIGGIVQFYKEEHGIEIDELYESENDYDHIFDSSEDDAEELSLLTPLECYKRKLGKDYDLERKIIRIYVRGKYEEVEVITPDIIYHLE